MSAATLMIAMFDYMMKRVLARSQLGEVVENLSGLEHGSPSCRLTNQFHDSSAWG